MREVVKRFFEENKIEYWSVVDYSHCCEINRRIVEKENFEPKSVIMFLIPYFVSVPANLSLYAASLDYHIIIKEFTDNLIEKLSALYPEYNFKGYGDHSPIDERHAALISGLGILGDNGLLINEKYGTYIFIADIVTDAPNDIISPDQIKEISHCEHCGSCRDACPTGILSGKHDECLSAITQRKGSLTEEEVEFMKKYNTVWGCDICQTACPHNTNPNKTPIDFFYIDRIEQLNSELINNMTDEDFSMRAFAWHKRETVMRNLKHLGY